MKPKLRDQLKTLDYWGLDERIRINKLTPSDQLILRIGVRLTPRFLEAIRKKTHKLKNLSEMLWGTKTESSRNVLKEIDEQEANQEVAPGVPVGFLEQPPSEPTAQTSHLPTEATPCPNNVIPIGAGKRRYKKGRKKGLRGADAYPDAEIVNCNHPTLKPGDDCPKCGKGTLYLMRGVVGKIIKLVGSPILKATRYNVHKLRCSACDWIFSAPLPEEAKGPRESITARAMVAIMKYGAGVPFYRLAQIQGYLKIPASASALWRGLQDLGVVGLVVWKEMRFFAAQGEVIHNDDTKNKVMTVIREQQRERQRLLRAEEVPKPKGKGPRKGIFTSGILAKTGSVKIMLFFTGHQNAGENLEALLAEREASLPMPIQMSDASTMNTPGAVKVHSGLCLSHDRRYFVKSYKNFKQASTHVIKQFKEVYKIEAQAKRLNLSGDDRLKLHQEKSGPIMEGLNLWLDEQKANKAFEENSEIGEAIDYTINHWAGLTLFLRVPGAPLTNDELEQKFKMIKRHLKNSLFYLTPWGALVGDMFMSIIHTCVLAGESPYDYLVAIQTHQAAVLKTPRDWMPWNYRKSIPAAVGPAIKTA